MITIREICQIARTFVRSNPKLNNITIDVRIIDVRVYRSMIFFKACDLDDAETVSISGVVYNVENTNDFCDNQQMQLSGNMEIFKGSLQFRTNHYQLLSGFIDPVQSILDQLNTIDIHPNNVPVPININNIGIISSSSAAGCLDFLQTLTQNNCNKSIFLYQSSMQGTKCSSEICRAINLANKQKIVDVIVIIRGGGSQEDLSWFNSIDIAVCIANSELPVITGIGHQIDITVADKMASKSYITPTAAAQSFIVKNEIDGITEKLFRSITAYRQYCHDKRKYLNYNQINMLQYYNYINQNINKIDRQIYNILCATHRYISEKHILCKNQLYSRVDDIKQHLWDNITGFNNQLLAINTLLDQYSQPIIISSGNVISNKSQITGNQLIVRFLDGDLHLNI
jgi:exodeoxyribonuclease VII large subunit